MAVTLDACHVLAHLDCGLSSKLQFAEVMSGAHAVAVGSRWEHAVRQCSVKLEGTCAGPHTSAGCRPCDAACSAGPHPFGPHS